jgi:hypothetical protein
MGWSCQATDSGLGPSDGASGAGQGGSAGGGVTPPAPRDWCSARSVLASHCVSCHTEQSPFGSIPLVTFEHLHARLPAGKYAFEAVKERIHDPQRLMPPTSDRLTAAELATLDGWVDEGAKPGANPSCTPGGEDAGGGAGGAGGNDGSAGAGGTGGASGASGAAGSAGADGGVNDGGIDGSSDVGVDGDGGTDAGPDVDGGTRPPTDWPTDCEQRYTLRAHGLSAPGDTTKFNVSRAPDRQFYQCFLFKAPWGADTVQSVRFRPIVDDARVVEHWILYGLDSAAGPDGQVGASACWTGNYLQGWAPGATETPLPADVGLQMPQGASAYLALEVHYNNTANYPDALDASGVELCVTKKLRPHTAAVQWLGSTNISLPPGAPSTVTGTCDPAMTQPVNIIAVHPHLQRVGVHARLVLNRAGGARETLHDAPFRFVDQKTYPVQAVVRDGDTLTTTCVYDNRTGGTVTFGANAENEACYNFVTAYPVGGLGALGTPNRCVSLF